MSCPVNYNTFLVLRDNDFVKNYIRIHFFLLVTDKKLFMQVKKSNGFLYVLTSFMFGGGGVLTCFMY